MIVRIMGEGQYRLDEETAERVNALDNEAVAAVESDDEDAFHVAFEQMLELIRNDGEHLADGELEASEVIVPPADITFVEAAADFTGDGLIPD
jgi:PspA-Associated protein